MDLPRAQTDAPGAARLEGELFFLDAGFLTGVKWYGAEYEFANLVLDGRVQPHEAIRLGWKPRSYLGREIRYVAPDTVKVVRAPAADELPVLTSVASLPVEEFTDTAGRIESASDAARRWLVSPFQPFTVSVDAWEALGHFFEMRAVNDYLGSA